MAKSSKKSKEAAPSGFSSPAATSEAQNGVNPALSEKSAAPKTSVSRPKSSGKHASLPTRKTMTGAKPRKSAAKRKTAPAEAAISDDAIRLRAYFIAEWRMQNGIEGDSAGDWLEASRQLREETASPA